MFSRFRSNSLNSFSHFDFKQNLVPRCWLPVHMGGFPCTPEQCSHTILVSCHQLGSDTVELGDGSHRAGLGLRTKDCPTPSSEGSPSLAFHLGTWPTI